MSSMYARYQGPSSLPSDYATLSRLSSNYESRTPESHLGNTVQISRRITRRESFPVSHYNRPLNPTIGVYPHSEAFQHLPTETSPLLDHPPVSQIEENSDYEAYAENTSTFNMFWEELAVLTKYAIPVFGYVPSFFNWKLTHPIFLQHSTSWIFSRRSVYHLYWPYFNHSSCCYKSWFYDCHCHRL